MEEKQIENPQALEELTTLAIRVTMRREFLKYKPSGSHVKYSRTYDLPQKMIDQGEITRSAILSLIATTRKEVRSIESVRFGTITRIIKNGEVIARNFQPVGELTTAGYGFPKLESYPIPQELLDMANN